MPRHNDFSNAQMRDMVCVYAQENFCSRRAAQRYLDLYPDRRQPNHKTFKALYDRLGETGSFRSKNVNAGRPRVIGADMEDEILVRVIENPETSTRRIEAATGVSKSSVSRIIRQEKLYPYHFTPVQNVLPQDFPARLQFSQFFRERQLNDPFFCNKILFTDEATFTRRGVFNWRNNHISSMENPNAFQEHHFQHEFSINIWCGIFGDCIVGPFELPAKLNGERYLNFLRNDLPILLEDVPLNLRRDSWYMHDGAPAHYSLQVRNYLDEIYPHKWIGRGSEYPWPARSPDLNPLDFYFWGYLKSLVYKNKINNRQELWQKIVEGVNTIRTQEESLFGVRQNLNKRIRQCVLVDGEHFEQLL